MRIYISWVDGVDLISIRRGMIEDSWVSSVEVKKNE